LVIKSACHAEGRGFESRPPRHLLPSAQLKAGKWGLCDRFNFKISKAAQKAAFFFEMKLDEFFLSEIKECIARKEDIGFETTLDFLKGKVQRGKER
jgi:hypothetical protein